MPKKSRFGGITARRTASTGFRALLGQREFRALWLADVQSLLGDQLGRVALTVLVYDRTGSGALTAGVYALTYLPALIGNLVLARWADRVPPRRLLVTGDVVRALLLATMALPAVPLWAVAALLVVAVMIGAPWKAGESALVAEILSGEGYVLGVALRVATVQGAQLVGFAVGGAAVAVVGPRAALGIDAATFVASAILLRLSLYERPPSGGTVARESGSGPRWSLFRMPALRVLVGYSWLAGLFIVPEGLAAPYADAIGGGATTVGLILAANPAGMLVGSILFIRLVGPDARRQWVAPLAVLSGVALIFCWSQPGLPLVVSVLAVSGAASAYQVQVMTEFVTSTPVEHRGQAIGVASGGLLAVQGLGLAAGGLVAEAAGVGPAIALAGIAGALVAGALTAARAQHDRQGGASTVEVVVGR